MKKFLKYFLIVPIVFIAIFSFFACGEDEIKSISLSIPNYKLTEGYYTIDKSILSSTSSGEKRVPLSVEITPNNYSPSNLKFEIKNFSGTNNEEREIVKEVRVRDKSAFIIFGDGVGQAKITASYLRKDKINVTNSISLLVSDNTNSLKFSEYTYISTYTGENLETNYRVIGDEDGNYNYTYYKINEDKGGTPTEVKNIIDCGKYWITCTNPEEENSYAETFLIVNKYKVNFKLDSFETCYGDAFSEGLYNENEIADNVIAETKATKILYGVGREKGESIGRYVEVTSANVGSGVGLYPVTVKMSLFSKHLQNYETDFDVEEGSLRITAKEVILKGKNQIGDNAISYGDKIKNGFELYSYSEYVENNEDLTLCKVLNSSDVDYTRDVSLGSAVYKVDGKVAIKNSVGQLDVLLSEDENSEYGKYGIYEVAFDNATTGRNLILKKVLSGALQIEPRDVSILPTMNQSKVYGTADPETITYSVVGGSVVNHDKIVNPLSIKYNFVEGDELGEGNYLANAGLYYYDIDDSLNLNYNFKLDESAVEVGGTAGTNKVTFEIKPCQIEIKLKDLVARYKTPKSQLHTVNYYGNAEDYKLKLESVTVGGKLADISTIEDGNAGQQGRINLETGGKFYFEISVDSNIIKDPNYFISYNIIMEENRWQTSDGAVRSNYEAKLLPVTLSLTKNRVTVLPNKDVRFSKVFDNTDNGTEIFDSVTGNLYSAVDENGEVVNLDEIVVNSTSLLTIYKNDTYYKLNSDGVYEECSSFIDVGRYKIFLIDSISYREDMEYYDLVLDDSEIYSYEITKASVLITIDLGLSKIYGAEDPDFTFTWSNLPGNDDEEYTGALERTAGEDVGEYAIGLGTLSFGINYDLKLSANLAVFKITPRKITVNPYSYSYVYGENDVKPLYNYVIEPGYNSNLLVAPVFSGEFSIVNSEDGSIITRDSAGFYPVNVVDDVVKSYSIAQGSFNCGTNNYTIEFSETATFTITKRDVSINIIAQQRENLGTVETENFVLASEFYTVSNLVGNVVTTLNILLNASNNYYCNVNQFDLSIMLNGTEVKDNYSIKMGADIVYRINMAIVYLSIVDKMAFEESNIKTSTYQATYKGEAFTDIFKLISTTEHYEIDYEESQFRFIFRKGEWSGENPINAGNYVASLDLSQEGDKLVIINNNAQAEEYKKITFTKDTLSEMQGNAVVNISSLGYLNILKAQITIKNNPEFLDNFVYEDKWLPRLKTSNAINEAIFEGVNGERVTLRDYDVKEYGGTNSRKLNFLGIGYSISNFQANYTYNIMVSVQKVIDTLNEQDRDKNENRAIGDVDSNYETLTITAVPLKVVPKPIEVQGNNFTIKNEPSIENLTYDGSLKSVNLALSTSGDLDEDGKKRNLYTTTYSYQRLSVTYGDENHLSRSANLRYRYYYNNGDTEYFDPTISTMPISSIGSNNITSFEIKQNAGTRYAIINNQYAFIMESENTGSISPENAGVYICIATCNTYENFTFSFYGNSTSASVQYATLFEIKKSENITFNPEKDWKKSFYYSTRFDFKNQDLPFEYNIRPSYLKQYVVISMDNYEDLSTSGYLNVGEYTAVLTINTENYYWVSRPTFEIEKLRVDFIFPLVKNYVYIGQNAKVDSFLSNIRIVRKDNAGVAIESFFYDPNSTQSKGILLSYYDRDNLDEKGNPTLVLDKDGNNTAPWNIGNYLLKMEYGTTDAFNKDNYYGCGEFEYSIIQRTFTGSIRVQNTILTYNPLYKQPDFYKDIERGMFRIDSDGGYNVKMYIGSYPQGVPVDESRLITVDTQIDYSNITRPEQLGWLKELSEEGQHYITFVVEFDDETIDSVQRDAILTIKKKTLTMNDFDINIGNTYTYDGYPKHNYIYYKDKTLNIPLNPDKEDYTATVGEYKYHFRSIKEVTDAYGNIIKDPHIVLMDNMFNVIFELRYEYLNNIGDNISAPIEPGTNYKSFYKIKGGANYMTEGLGEPFNTFKIEKMNTLYVYIKNVNDWMYSNIRYTGSNLLNNLAGNSGKLYENYLKDLIIIKQDFESSSSNVYNTLYYNGLYKPEYGVYLQIFFTDSNNTITDQIVKAGKYKLHLGLAYTSTYDLVKYFDYVKIGMNAEAVPTNTLKRAEYDGIPANWYNVLTEIEFEVKKGDSPYDASNYFEAFTFTGQKDTPVIQGDTITISTYGTNVFVNLVQEQINNLSLTIRVRVGNSYVIEKVITDESKYEFDITKEYRLTVSGNDFEESDYIYVKFTT